MRSRKKHCLATEENKCIKLNEEVIASTTKVQKLGIQLENQDISKLIIDEGNQSYFYTGIYTLENLPIILNFINEIIPVNSQKEALTNYEQFVLLLVKIRLNLRPQDIANHFCISQASVSFFKSIELSFSSVNCFSFSYSF